MIGTGISGLGAAYALSKGHEVELFERDDRAGGHSNTVEHVAAGRTLRLDTGFIVHNEETYPNLVRLFRELGVRTQPSEMSFSVACQRHDLEYSGGRPPLTRLTLEIARFLHLGRRALDDPRCADWSLARYVAEEGYSPRFRDHFLVPLCAALWSTAPSRTLDFPLVYAVRFFANHGLLGFRRLRWKTVTGGSQSYVRALEERLQIHRSTEVRSIRRLADGIELRLAGDELRRFDGVVVATHADQALRLLPDANGDERRLLGAFAYSRNRAVLHGDAALMPRRRAVWSSWNYGADRRRPDALCVTYWMNRLQAIDDRRPLFLTLNPSREPRAELVHRTEVYEHPLFDANAIRAQNDLWSLQGRRRTWFCGAYFGAGFHEDGLQAGLAVAEAIGGVRRPWSVARESSRIRVHGTPARRPGVGGMSAASAAAASSAASVAAE